MCYLIAKRNFSMILGEALYPEQINYITYLPSEKLRIFFSFIGKYYIHKFIQNCITVSASLTFKISPAFEMCQKSNYILEKPSLLRPKFSRIVLFTSCKLHNSIQKKNYRSKTAGPVELSFCLGVFSKLAISFNTCIPFFICFSLVPELPKVN